MCASTIRYSPRLVAPMTSQGRPGDACIRGLCYFTTLSRTLCIQNNTSWRKTAQISYALHARCKRSRRTTIWLLDHKSRFAAALSDVVLPFPEKHGTLRLVVGEPRLYLTTDPHTDAIWWYLSGYVSALYDDFVAVNHIMKRVVVPLWYSCLCLRYLHAVCYRV